MTTSAAKTVADIERELKQLDEDLASMRGSTAKAIEFCSRLTSVDSERAASAKRFFAEKLDDNFREWLIFDKNTEYDLVNTLILGGHVIKSNKSVFQGLSLKSDYHKVFDLLKDKNISSTDLRVALVLYSNVANKLSLQEQNNLIKQVVAHGRHAYEQLPDHEQAIAQWATFINSSRKSGYWYNTELKTVIIPLMQPNPLSAANNAALVDMLDTIVKNVAEPVEEVYVPVLQRNGYISMESFEKFLNKKGYKVHSGEVLAREEKHFAAGALAYPSVPGIGMREGSSYLGGLPLRQEAYTRWPHFETDEGLEPLNFLGSYVDAATAERIDVFVSTQSKEEYWELTDSANGVVSNYDDLPSWLRPKAIKKSKAPTFAKKPIQIEVSPERPEAMEWEQSAPKTPFGIQSVVRIAPAEITDSIELGDQDVLYILKDTDGNRFIEVQSQ